LAEENKALAAFLNAYFPHFLADITKDLNTQVVHMSTDCVFSGKRGSYTGDDLRDGESFYDRSKALGELNDGKNITLCNSIVGPDVNPNGIGLLNWFMKQKGEVTVVPALSGQAKPRCSWQKPWGRPCAKKQAAYITPCRTCLSPNMSCCG